VRASLLAKEPVQALQIPAEIAWVRLTR